MKTVTQNEYHKSVNRVVDYINNHLQDSLDLTNLAQVAHISEFHFHRIFRAFIGEPLGTYISRLRLESAAQKLQTTTLTLTEIAQRTGYQSQYALSKAFKKHFGITPSAFRNLQTYFSTQMPKAKPAPLNITPEIREISPKKLVYIRIIAQYGSSDPYETAWKKLWKFAKSRQIVTGQNEFIGLNFDDPSITKPEKCRFYACITTEKDIKPEGEFGIQKLNGGKYAVFTLRGSYSGLIDLYEYIYHHWLSKSGCYLRNSMPFEKYLNNPDKVNEADILTEIFIPIK
ncbi:MAG: AraC family transcriptional regulator [Bacteroidota bacterium]